MRKRLATVGVSLAAVAGIGIMGAPDASAQTITGYYCSVNTAVPGASGTFASCATFALSALSGGPVSKPYVCRLVNGTNKDLNWYREAWTGGGGVIVDETSYGTHVPPGTWDVNCNAALPDWLYRNTHNYVRASVQVSDSTFGTAGANAVSP